MDLIQVLILAVLQGLVEFLPISSSGHLILVPALLGWSDQGLAFDIAVHVGTLAAVVFYFRRDLKDLAVAIFQPDLLGWLGRQRTPLYLRHRRHEKPERDREQSPAKQLDIA